LSGRVWPVRGKNFHDLSDLEKRESATRRKARKEEKTNLGILVKISARGRGEDSGPNGRDRQDVSRQRYPKRPVRVKGGRGGRPTLPEKEGKQKSQRGIVYDPESANPY